MLRTLRTKVSAHRLRREPSDLATPTPPSRRVLHSLRRATLSKSPAPHDWRAEDGVRVHVHTEISTPDLVPDASPDSSSPASLATPHVPKTPSDLEPLGGDARKPDSSFADATLNTVVLHQHSHPEAPSLSHTMINNIWDIKDGKEEASLGLGITAPHLHTGETSPFPTSEQLQSLLTLNSPQTRHDKSTTPVSIRSGDAVRLQDLPLPLPPANLTIKKMPDSPSILSIKTVDTQGSLGLHTASPSGVAPAGFMALMHDTGFPSPPIRAQAPDLLDESEASKAAAELAERPSQKQAGGSQPTPWDASKKLKGLRNFALSAAVETSSLAQRRKARFTAAEPLSRPSSFTRNVAEPEPPITPVMAQSFKDKYPPTLNRRRPMLGVLPPTPVSATMYTVAAAAAAQRPPHLSPHLSLEEAVQMSLGPTPLPRNTAGRRVSSLMYLRDGKPIAAGPGGSSPLARANQMIPTLDAIRSSTGPLFAAGSPLLLDSPRASELRSREGTPEYTHVPLSSNPTESPQDFHTPTLPWTPTVAQASTTRPVHPPNMTCLAGCCARPADPTSSPVTFHAIKAQPSRRLARVSSMASQHSRMLSNGSGFKIPEMPKIPALPKPHQVKKAQSSPELKMDFKRPRPSMQEERPACPSEENMSSNKRKKHSQGKKNKSISSLRFLTRAFSKEPQLPVNATNVAIALDTETKSIRRISVDSNESWGPTNGDLCLPNLQTQTFIAFQALPTPPASSPIVPSMSLRRPSQGSPISSNPQSLVRMERSAVAEAEHTYANPAKILQSTVESAMLNPTISMTASQMSISDSAPMMSIPSLPRVVTRVSEHQGLGEAFEFPRNTSDGRISGTPQASHIAKQRDSLMSQWEATLAPFDVVSEENSPDAVRSRSGKDLDQVIDLEESVARTSSSLSHVLSSADTDSREGRARGMSWDSGAFSLERQIERLRELESPEQASESSVHLSQEEQSPSTRSRTQSAPVGDEPLPLVSSENVLASDGFHFPGAAATMDVRTPDKSLGLSSSLSVVTPPHSPAVMQPSQIELPTVQLPWITTQSPSPTRGTRTIPVAVSGVAKKASRDTPVWLPRLDIEEAPLLAGTGFAF